MKKILLTLALSLTLIGSVNAQAVAACLTMEQQQEAYNKKKACEIAVVNTSSQQLQTYYWQLGTYWQQLHKDNQQKAKDIQQIAKDAQQVGKDLQQIATDKMLADKMSALNYDGVKYDELDAFLQILIPLLGNCNNALKEELTKTHINRSGGGDATNPGGGGNFNGFQNPGYLNHVAKGL